LDDEIDEGFWLMMQEHHSKSSSASQPTHQAHIQWRGEAQPSHFQISNLNLIVLNVVRLVEPKAMHVHRL
jgi:hypothetical protein